MKDINNLNVKEEGKDILKGLAYITVVLITLSYFSKGIFSSWLILLGFNALYLKFTDSLTFAALFRNGVILAAILFLFRSLSGFGIFGYILGIVLIVALILYKRRDKYLQIKHHGETMIWGKPLKEFKKDGQRPPKLKITR